MPLLAGHGAGQIVLDPPSTSPHPALSALLVFRYRRDLPNIAPCARKPAPGRNKLFLDMDRRQTMWQKAFSYYLERPNLLLRRLR